MRNLLVISAFALLGGCTCRPEPTFVITFEPRDAGMKPDQMPGAAPIGKPVDKAPDASPLVK